MKKRKLLAAIIALGLLAAMLGGCGLDTNGLWHFECGGYGFTGCDFDGCYINGTRACTNHAALADFDREVEACRQALADCTDEMDIIAEELIQYGSFNLTFSESYNSDRFEIYSYEREEYISESGLSDKTVAAIEALENSGRFDRFTASENEDGSLHYEVKLNARTPGYGVDAHRGGRKERCSSLCEPLDDGWCLVVWEHI